METRNCKIKRFLLGDDLGSAIFKCISTAIITPLKIVIIIILNVAYFSYTVYNFTGI